MKKILNKKSKILILLYFIIVVIIFISVKNIWWKPKKADIKIKPSENGKISRPIERYIFTDKWNCEGKNTSFIGQITVDRDGYIYAATGIPVDPNSNDMAYDALERLECILADNCSVQKFDSGGRFMTEWKIADQGILTGIEYNVNGYIYIICSGLWVYDVNGKSIKHLTIGGNGLSCDDNGNIYITLSSTVGRGIGKYDSDGNKIGSMEPDDGSILGRNRYLFRDIGIIPNIIYVMGAIKSEEGYGDFCIGRFDETGKFTHYINNFSWRTEPHITINKTNKYFCTILVSDSDKNQVEEFSSDGKLLGTFGSSGNRDGEFNNPGDIAVDSKGNIYVVDIGNNRIQKFAPNSILK